MNGLKSILIELGMTDDDIISLAEDEEFAQALEAALRPRPTIVRDFPENELEDWV